MLEISVPGALFLGDPLESDLKEQYRYMKMDEPVAKASDRLCCKESHFFDVLIETPFRGVCEFAILFSTVDPLTPGSP